MRRLLCIGWLVLGAGLMACTAAPENAAPGNAPEAGTAPMTDTTAAASTSGGATSASSSAMTGTTGSGATTAAGTSAMGSTFAAVKGRGKLVCGVNDQIPGFGYLDKDGSYKGFDVDFCRAIAAAIFGDATAVDFRPLTAQQRFTALQTGEVDVLIRNTTWTLSRDTQNGLDFAPVTFYDGQAIMVRKDSAVKTLADLGGSSICVTSGTTTEQNLEDAMRTAGVQYTPVVLESADTMTTAYDQGRCDAQTADRSALVSRQATLSDPPAHVILDDRLSKEPLAPAVLQGDANWADIVNWVVLGTIAAEEYGVTSKNVDEMATTGSPEVKRLLGAEEKLGEGLGLSNTFMVSTLKSVGNYGEIYDRNLGAGTTLNLARGSNAQWKDGGLLYAPPFR